MLEKTVDIEYRENEETSEYEGYISFKGKIHRLLDFKELENNKDWQGYKRINEVLILLIKLEASGKRAKVMYSVG